MADRTLAIASEVLGLELRLTERGLRFRDPATGRDLPDLAETDEALEHAEQARRRERQARREVETRLANEAAARQAAEERVKELEELLRRNRARDVE